MRELFCSCSYLLYQLGTGVHSKFMNRLATTILSSSSLILLQNAEGFTKLYRFSSLHIVFQQCIYIKAIKNVSGYVTRNSFISSVSEYQLWKKEFLLQWVVHGANLWIFCQGQWLRLFVCHHLRNYIMACLCNMCAFCIIVFCLYVCRASLKISLQIYPKSLSVSLL